MKNYFLITVIVALFSLSYEGLFSSEKNFHLEYLNKERIDCNELAVKLLVCDSVFQDTILKIRNYRKNDSNILVICNAFNSLQYEDLVFNYSRVEYYLELLERLGKKAILDLTKQKNGILIADFYLYSKTNFKTLKMLSFEIENMKIKGIIVLPYLFKEYIPIEEFENDDFEHQEVIIVE